MKTCSRCHRDLDVSLFPTTKDGVPRSWCRGCAAEWQREYRKKYPERKRLSRLKYQPRAKELYEQHRAEELAKGRDYYQRTKTLKRLKNKLWRENNREKVIAHRLLNNAILYGHLDRADTCQHCGVKRKTEAHHADYSKPFDVLWLCHSCHNTMHRNGG